MHVSLYVDIEHSLREQVSAEVNKFHSNIQQVISEQFNNSTQVTIWIIVYSMRFLLDEISVKFVRKIMDICDQVCKNQPSKHTKIASFFRLCCVITHVLVMVTG